VRRTNRQKPRVSTLARRRASLGEHGIDQRCGRVFRRRRPRRRAVRPAASSLEKKVEVETAIHDMWESVGRRMRLLNRSLLLPSAEDVSNRRRWTVRPDEFTRSDEGTGSPADVLGTRAIERLYRAVEPLELGDLRLLRIIHTSLVRCQRVSDTSTTNRGSIQGERIQASRGGEKPVSSA